MKKLFLSLLLTFLALGGLRAQHYEHVYMLDVDGNYSYYYCKSEVDGVIVHGQSGNCFMPPNCQSDQDQLYSDTVVVTHDMQGWWTWLWMDEATGDNYIKMFAIYFTEEELPASIWDENEVYKCAGESIVLEAPQGNGWHYQWSNGATDRSIVVSAPGTYSVVISFCDSKTYEITVNDYDTHFVDLGPDIMKCANETVTLDAGEFVTYQWSDGSTERTINVLEAGIYHVAATDENGCVSQDEVLVTNYENPSKEIQVVTIDTLTGSNKVVWNVNDEDRYQTIQIFRESSTEQYELIDEVPYNEGSFVDVTASQNQAWRYKIAAVDFCGDLSYLSDYHQNIFASVMPLATGGTVIMWTQYDGRTVSRYHIMSTEGFGNDWDPQIVASVSGNVTAYNMPDQTTKYFVVAAEFEQGKSYGGLTFSNIVSNPFAIGEIDAEDVQVSPVPTTDNVVITCPNLHQAEVINAFGQCVAKAKGEGERLTIDLSTLPTGIYFVNITDKEGRKCVKKVVKE